MAYTKGDLDKARAALRREVERWENYSGNNPNKYESSIRQLRKDVAFIYDELVRAGVIESRPKTEKELLEDMLDRTFPNARGKEIVEYQGQKYQRRFWPLEKSNSGKTVKIWGHGWTLIEE